MASLDRPHGTTLAALKGIAITTSLLTAGQLGTTTLSLPSLYPAAQTSHRLAAQQFARQCRLIKATAPAGIISSLIFSGLAFIGYNHNANSKGTWKLWASAAAALLTTIPWTTFFMTATEKKLLWVSEVADSATTPLGPPSTGIGLKITSDTPTKQANGGLSYGGITTTNLGVPNPKGHVRDGSITPIEEFEPFEDAIVGDEYEQLKVIKLLQRWNWYNSVRVLGPLSAGVMGIWAVLTE